MTDGDRLQKIQEIVEEVLANGHKCQDHEATIRTVGWLRGGFAVVLLLLGFISVTNYNTLQQISNNTATLQTLRNGTLNTAVELDQHEELPAHVIGEQWFYQNLEFHASVLERFNKIEDGNEESFKEINKKLDKMMSYHSKQ